MTDPASMRFPSIRGVIAGGSAIGCIRGIIEGLALYGSHPVRLPAASLARLCFQTGVLYAVVIAGIGTLLIMLFRRAGLVSDRVRWLWPLLFLVPIVLIDLNGWSHRHRTVFQEPVLRGTPSRPDFPDILLFTLDTCRADRLGCYGYPTGCTPVIDALSRRSALFVDAFTTIPVTTSAHATIMTGLEPMTHGSRFNAVPLHRRFTTLAERLQDEGYRTGAFIGSFSVVAEVYRLDQGIHVYEQTLSPRYLHPLLYQSTLLAPIRSIGRFRPAERCAEQIEPWVDAWWRALPPDAPRLTWLHYYDPHAPYDPPDQWRRIFTGDSNARTSSIWRIHAMNHGEPPVEDEIRTNLGLYDGEIAQTDRAIGRILEVLASTGRLGRTMIVVMADHGESLDEHEYFFSHGDNTFDPSLRIPFLIATPMSTSPEKVVAAGVARGLVAGLTGNADLVPTLLAALGLSAPDALDGRVRATDGGEARADRVLICESGSGVYIEAHRATAARISRKARAVRTGRMKLVRSSDGRLSAFDLEKDPRELQPIANAQDPRVIRLREILEASIVRDSADPRYPVLSGDQETVDQLRELGYVE